MSWTLRRFALTLFIGGILAGQGSLRLKNVVPAAESRDARAARDDQRLHHGWEHLIVETGPDTPADIREILQSRGARVLRAVPDSGFLLAARSDLDVSDLHLTQARQMDPREKLSAHLRNAGGPTFYVVEFHPDVPETDARAVVARHGLTVQENADVLPTQLLVKGTFRSIARLARWDEVAYVFPASKELINGEPVHGCAGALTASGTVGQYIATYGDGWDGPGRGSASLNYAFARLTEKQPRDVVASVLSDALAEWARAAKLTFTYADRVDGPRTLSFLFAAGAHGDSYPFDGPGKVLAHTFYPAPPNPEPVAGDLHFDDDEHWAIGADIDMFSVVLHEIGHALGLGHADKPGAVMYPYYSRVTKLSDDDIAAIQTLYAPAGSDAGQPLPLTLTVAAPSSTAGSVVTITGAVSGGFGETRVTWRTGAGASGTASGVPNWTAGSIPLAVGTNQVTFTAIDSQSRTAVKAVTIMRSEVPPTPQILITGPQAGNVSDPNVTVTGTASAAGGIATVRWTSSRGGSGVATGTASWSAKITLVSGANVITFFATAVSGAQVSASVALNYSPPISGPDTTAPTLTITSPSSTVVSTTASTIRLAGTSRDNVGVIEVGWSASTGSTGVATGTTNWTAAVPLLLGDNTITVRAKDAAGNAGWRSVVVTRR